MTADPFASFATTPDDPYSNALEVMPSDTANLPVTTRALLINGLHGIFPVRVMLQSGATVTLFLMSGIPHPIRATRIYATGTALPDTSVRTTGVEDVTAAGIVALW